MATKTTEGDKHPSMDDMVEFGISRVLEAFGKGENLRSAVFSIVNASAHWGAENEKRYKAELAKHDGERKA